MTLDQLRIFVVVAESLHVTRAAEHLHLTQSAVSAAIAALERRWDVKLFDRVGRRVELSPVGEAFLPHARAVLDRARDAERFLGGVKGLESGKVEVFASQTVGGYWLPSRLVRFHGAHPGIELRVQVGNTAEGVSALLAGGVELIVVEGVVDEPGLEVEQVGSDRLVVLTGPDDPWTDKPYISARELERREWVLRERGSGTRARFEEALRGMSVAPESLRIALELPSNEAICAVVAAGGGVTALSELVPAGTLKRLPVELPERPFFLAWHRERGLSPAGAALAQLVRGA